jgi:uracil-DNA glycosylase family 4
MNDSRRDFLELVTQIRSHLEYHRALGVRYVETLVPGALAAAEQRETGASIRPAAEPAIQGQAPEAETGLAAVRNEITNCTRCKLHTGRNSIVFGEGNPEAVLVFVGEGPGQEEDVQGRPFVGSAGQLLTDIIVKGMRLKREDVYICNIVKCRPPDNRNPEADEIGSCEPFLAKQLRAIGPRVIVALGNVAARTLLKTGEGITALRGTWHDYQGIPLMPTFHPAYLLRNPKDKKLVWEDIQQVMTKLGLPVTR